jgi:hypothetical protein
MTEVFACLCWYAVLIDTGHCGVTSQKSEDLNSCCLWGSTGHFRSEVFTFCGLGSSVGIATGYGLDGPGIEPWWGVRFSALVQTGLGAHPASCTMGTGSFPGVKSAQGVTLTPHPLLVPWSWKSRAIPLLPPMGRTACTEPQCLYKGDLYHFFYIHSELFYGVPLNCHIHLPRSFDLCYNLCRLQHN